MTESTVTPINTRFTDDPNTVTLGDDFGVLRPKALSNGAEILAYFPEDSRSGIVLAHWRTDEYVTWRTYWVSQDGLAHWDCEVGHYFRGRDQELAAWQDFILRAAINPITDEESA